MRKILTAVLTAIACCAVALFAAACGDVGGAKPKKLKDGIAITITEGESKSLDLSEYISLEGTQYAYTVDSSPKDIATVSVDGNTATVVAVAEGSATVTASADEVSVSFAVTVTAKQQITPVEVDKTALVAELALEVSGQGDYTEESYAAYKQKLEAAKAVNAKADATQTEVDNACDGLKKARLALTERVPEEVADADKIIAVVSGLTKEIIISDYIDAKNLSSVTYEVKAGGTLVTVGEIEDGKFTVTAGQTDEDTEVSLDICAKYKGETKLTVTLTVQVKSEVQPTLKHSHVTQSADIYSLENKAELIIDFTQNVESNGVENLTYSVTSGGAPVTLDGDNRLTYNLDGAYSETVTEVVFNVTVTYGAGKSIDYVYTLHITDTSAYRVVNGGFDNGLDGWTLDGEIGAISENSTFWGQGFPIFNEGKYFSGDGKEAGKGTLTSSEFKVGGAKKITFMLGAAGNKDCYITLEKTDGTVLAIWRNAKFKDVGKWDINEIGKTQFACNLVTYVADLADYEGQTLKIVLHDNAEKDFGFFNFDELVTYYAAEKDIPANAFDAKNEIADKSALKTILDNALTSAGDYTAESYSAYAERVAAAQAVLDKVSATQTEVDSAKTAVDNAFAALRLREPEEKAGADKSFSLLVNGNKELTVSDYVDDKNLSSLTYEVASADGKVTVSAVAGGKFTVTAGSEEVEGVTVSIIVKYKGETALTVTLTVNVTSETAPVLKETAVSRDIDLYTAANKTEITLDFASNVENVGGLALTYSVTLNGNPLTLDGTSYTYAYASYTEETSEVVFAVTVTFNRNSADEEISYNYTLKIKDTRAYRITNGSFDDGLDGWTLSNPDLGTVNADKTYWNENVPFNADGKFFNAYAFGDSGKDAIESAMGTLTSSAFKIGGSGWITYKLGGAKNADKVFLDVIEKDTGTILARYYNNAFSDDISQAVIRGCTLLAYKADLSAHIGKTVYIRISDNAVRDYGLFFVDSFATYYPEEPADFNAAVAVTVKPENIYKVLNGGFETGDLTGWECVDGEVPGKVSNLTGYWGDNKNYNKDGEWLFTGAEGQNNQTDPNLEYRKGTLRSNVFTLKAGGWISFKLGGTIHVEATNIKVVKADGTVLAVFHNSNPVTQDGGEVQLVQYIYQFTDLAEDTECYFEMYDNAESGWGLIVADSFKTDYTSAPELEGAVTATNKNN